MLFRTPSGSPTEIKQELIDALKLRLLGKVVSPADSSFEEYTSIWNGMISRKPALVIRCLGTSDVITCVQFARENNIILCLRGGGHNIAGLAIAEGGLMLDMSLMRGVWVDPQNKIAHAQAGCLLSDVDRETQIYGLATVLGFVSQTGIAGLTLGGGFGYLTRRWGWTADNVTGVNIVTAEGKLVHASSAENPDLFWALKGGGGNFGVVTEISYKLYNVGPEIIGGLVAWDISEAPKVLEFYRTFSETAPAELTLVTLIRPAPPAPWLPKEMHGKLIAGILACYSGDPAEGEKIVSPLKSFGKPVGDVLIRRPYSQMQSMLDATQPKGRRYYWKSEYLNSISPELIGKFLENAPGITSPHSALILFQLGGALNQLPADHSPVGNRDARYLFNISGSWEKPEHDSENIEWVRKVWNELKPYSTGGTYVNFLTEDDGPERDTVAYGNALKKLSAIKAKWDPDNMFCSNRNIQPAKGRPQTAAAEQELA